MVYPLSWEFPVLIFLGGNGRVQQNNKITDHRWIVFQQIAQLQFIKSF